MQSAARLKGYAVSGRTQSRSEACAGVLFEDDFTPFDGSPVPRREAEIALHCNDAGPDLADATRPAQNIYIVARGLLDDLKLLLALANQFSHERERSAMQKASAERNRATVFDARG